MSICQPAAEPVVKVMRLDALTVDELLQPRANGLNGDIVKEYAESLAAGAKFPPLVVYSDSDADADAGKHWLSEGFHRHAAYLKAGRLEVECEIRKGDRGSALFNSCGSNRTHGLRRSSADKRRAIELLIAAFPECSDRWIADGVGCDHKTVGAVRNPKPKSEQSSDCTGEFPQCNGLNNSAQQGTLPGCSEDEPEPKLFNLNNSQTNHAEPTKPKPPPVPPAPPAEPPKPETPPAPPTEPPKRNAPVAPVERKRFTEVEHIANEVESVAKLVEGYAAKPEGESLSPKWIVPLVEGPNAPPEAREFGECKVLRELARALRARA